MKKKIKSTTIQLDDLYKAYTPIKIKKMVMEKSGTENTDELLGLQLWESIYVYIKVGASEKIVQTLRSFTKRQKILCFRNFKHIFPFFTHRNILLFCERERIRLEKRLQNKHGYKSAYLYRNNRIILSRTLYSSFIAIAWKRYQDPKGLVLRKNGGYSVIKDTEWLRSVFLNLLYVENKPMGSVVSPSRAFNRDSSISKYLYIQILWNPDVPQYYPRKSAKLGKILEDYRDRPQDSQQAEHNCVYGRAEGEN